MSRKFHRIAHWSELKKSKTSKRLKTHVLRKIRKNTKYKYWTWLNWLKIFPWSFYKTKYSWGGLFCNFRDRKSYKISRLFQIRLPPILDYNEVDLLLNAVRLKSSHRIARKIAWPILYMIFNILSLLLL